jgi:hypothetical protein
MSVQLYSQVVGIVAAKGNQVTELEVSLPFWDEKISGRDANWQFFIQCAFPCGSSNAQLLLPFSDTYEVSHR